MTGGFLVQGRRAAPAAVRVRPRRAGTPRHLSFRAWALIAALPVVTGLGLLAGPPGFLKLAYPAVGVAAGAALLRWYPAAYVGFVWWLWLLTPLARRLVDFRGGWDDTNPILVAPLLVTGLCGATLFRHLPKLRQRSLLPYGMLVVALAYAHFLGVLQFGVSGATYTLLLYAAPLCFGFHVAVHWKRYHAYRDVTRGALSAGVLVMGVYGVWQFFDPQPWDAYWMVNAEMPTVGLPEPMEVRVFSTLNSPMPFAMVMVSGLLLLFSGRPAAHGAAGVPGYLSLLLSLVRAAWVSWAVGFLVYLAYTTTRGRIRLLLSAGPVVALVMVLAGTPAIEGVVGTRLSTFGALEEDFSLRVRAQMYLEFFTGHLRVPSGEEVRLSPLGNGFGGTGAGAKLGHSWPWAHFDSGILDIIQAFGVPGALLFYGAILLLFQQVMRPALRRDRFTAAARGISAGVFAAMVAQNTLVGVTGVFFWGFTGFCVAARRVSAEGTPR